MVDVPSLNDPESLRDDLSGAYLFWRSSTGNYVYNATYLCRFHCIGGDHDYAAAPCDAPRGACKLSDALRFLERNRGRTIVPLTWYPR
jgi:hypothetical protein